jgi:hypothetical protein
MYLIQQITSDPVQKQTLILPNGSPLNMEMRFVPLQYGWFITSLAYGTFLLEGLRITVSPNFLRQFKNQIPFGMSCVANNVSREPTLQPDFSSGAFSLFILDQDEVAQLEGLLSG